VATYGAKYPKACECLSKDRAELLTFYDFPAEHGKHLRTTNPIESTFATVRLRHRRTRGSGSRTACLTMVYKLMQSAPNAGGCSTAPSSSTASSKELSSSTESNPNKRRLKLLIHNFLHISSLQIRNEPGLRHVLMVGPPKRVFRIEPSAQQTTVLETLPKSLKIGRLRGVLRPCGSWSAYDWLAIQ
jgi:hypothetical protein